MWWQSTRLEKRRFIFRLPSRRRAEAESPLRVAAPRSIPNDVGILSSFADRPEPVDWLMRRSTYHPEPVTAINLTSFPEEIEHGSGLERGPSVNVNPLPGKLIGADTSTGDDIPSLLERLRILLAAPLHALLPGPETVLEWPGELMPFQKDGVRTLINSDRVLLADDMGLGKTLQVVAALRILFVQRAIKSALVVAPATLLDQWRQELAKWAPDLKAIIIRGSAS